MGAISLVFYNMKNPPVNIDLSKAFLRMKTRGEDDTQIGVESTPAITSFNKTQISNYLSRREITEYRPITFHYGYHRLSINDISLDGSQPFDDPIAYKLMKYPELRSRLKRRLLCNGEIYNYNSLVSDNKFTEWKFDGDTVVFDYAVDNVYFLSWLREVYFDIVNKTNTKNIKEVMLRTPKTLWGYYSVAGIEDQDYFTPWRKYLEKDKKKIKNLEFNLLKDSNMFDMQKHIRKSFYSFVNRF